MKAASFYRLAHIRPRSLIETASLIHIFKRRLFYKDNPQGSERNQNSENEQRTLSACPLLSSLPPYSYFHFLLLSLSSFSFCPHISSTLHPCQRCHCKCHVENEGGGLLFVPGEASFLYSGRHQRGQLSSDGGKQAAHAHIKRQIFWSLQLRL